MEGKKITKTLELENGYMGLLLDDEEVAIVKIVTPDLSLDEIREFVGAVKAEKTKDKEKPKEEPEDDEEDGEDYTWQDLLDMNFKELKKNCKEWGLEVDPSDYSKEEADDLREAMADEVGIEIPKKEETKDDDDEDDKYTWKDLEEMDREELSQLVDEEDLTTDPEDFDDDEEDKFRRAIAEEMNIEPPPKKKKKK